MVLNYKEKVSKILLDYIDDDSKKQAVLLDGKWGSGKTYFITNYFKNSFEDASKEEKDKKLIYVSLYGKRNVEQVLEDIRSKFIEKALKDFYDKGNLNRFCGKFRNKFKLSKVKKISSIGYKILSASLKTKDIDVGELPGISDLIDVKNVVIIFDDLERCCMNINEILGYINNLIEHYDVKAIIVANEEEIGKISYNDNLPMEYLTAINYARAENNEDSNNKFSKDKLVEKAEELFLQDSLYERIKEKTIGLVVKYDINFCEAYDDIVNSDYIKSEKTKNYLLDDNIKKEVIKVFNNKNYNNMRTLICSLSVFDKFMDIILNLNLDDEYDDYIIELEKEVLKYCIDVSINIKTGYRSGFLYKENFEFIRNYFVNGYMDEGEIKDKFKDIIMREKKEREERERDLVKQEEIKNLSLNKLTNRKWYYLEDDEIDTLLKLLKEELEGEKYFLQDFREIAVLLMQIEKFQFKIDKESYINSMKSQIKKFKNTINKGVLDIYTTDNEFYKSYLDFIRPLKDELDRTIDSSDVININKILGSDENSSKNLYDYCKDNRDKFTDNKKFLYYFDVEKYLVNWLKKASAKDLGEFYETLSKIYSFSNLNEFFKADIPNLNLLDSHWSEIENEHKDSRTHRFWINKIKEKLDDSLNKINS